MPDQISRRALLIAAGMMAVPLSGFGGSVVAGGSGGSGGSALTTRTLVNNTGSTMAAGTVTQSFGESFKKGDIPAIATTTISTSSGSGTVTVASATGLAVGQFALSDALPACTRITGVSGTTVTLSATANRTGSGIGFVIPGAPKYTVSGVTQPLSWGLMSLWSDNSLKFMRGRLRASFSLANLASQQIQIASGGNQPTASARTLTEVYAQGIKLNATATTGVTQTTSGALAAWLNGTTNVNNVFHYGGQPNITLDGDAGKGWTISCAMSALLNGTAHPNLVVDFDIDLLTDAAGALGGVELLPSVVMPWYNSGTPPTAAGFDAASCNFQWGGGPTTVTLPWPYPARTFTSNSTSTFLVATANWYRGSVTQDMVPCYVSSTGTLPTNISALTMLGAISYDGATPTSISFYGGPDVAGNPITAGSNGTGTHTVTPIPIVSPFERLYFAGTDGRFNPFQGTGTGNTGTSTGLNWQFDKAYLQNAGLLMPYKLSATVADTTWANYSWTPYSIGDLSPYEFSTGPRPDLAFVPQQNIMHLYNQSSVSELLTRSLGLAHGHMAFNFREKVSTSLVNVSNTTYAGMPAAAHGTVQYAPGHSTLSQGWTQPTPFAYPIVFSEVDGDHRPQLSYYPYLITGEPQYLRQLSEAGLSGILAGWGNTGAPFNSWVNVTDINSVTYYGVVAMCDGEIRTVSWANRDLQMGAAMQPASSPDGSQFPTYIKTQAALTTQWHAATMDAEVGHTTTNNAFGPSATSFHVTNGIWAPAVYNNNTAPALCGGTAMFEICYMLTGMGFAAKALEDQNALNWCLTQATFFNFINTNWGDWSIPCYYMVNTSPAGYGGLGGLGWPPITQLSDWGFNVGGAGNNTFTSLTWASGGKWTMGTNAGPGYVPHAGDTLRFCTFGNGTPSPIPSAASYDQTYTLTNVVNAGGGNYTFDLVGLTLTNSGTCANFAEVAIAQQAVNTPAAATGKSLSGSNEYFCYALSCVRLLQALGDSTLGTVESNLTTRFAASGGTAIPEWNFQSTFN